MISRNKINSEVTDFKKCAIENTIVSIQFHTNFQIYILDICGDVYLWGIKNSENPIKIDSIPKIVAICSTRDCFYFVGKDGSLWIEQDGEINQIQEFKDVKNIFSNLSNVFLLCENGRILWKGSVPLIAYSLEKTNEFVEICTYSNVKSISTSANFIFFVLDDGSVFTLLDDVNHLKDIDFIFHSTIRTWFLDFNGQLLTSNGEAAEISVLDAVPLFNTAIILSSDAIGEIVEKKFIKFAISEELPFINNKKSARK